MLLSLRRDKGRCLALVGRASSVRALSCLTCPLTQLFISITTLVNPIAIIELVVIREYLLLLYPSIYLLFRINRLRTIAEL